MFVTVVAAPVCVTLLWVKLMPSLNVALPPVMNRSPDPLTTPARVSVPVRVKESLPPVVIVAPAASSRLPPTVRDPSLVRL